MGFTIIETLIFLAVSIVLFAAIGSSISGQQSRTQFTNSIRDIETALQDIINDVDAGYFPDNNISLAGLSCNSSGLTSVNQGTRSSCIFAGKAVQFDINAETYNVYTLAGQRRPNPVPSPSRDVENIDEANPQIVPSYTEGFRLSGALKFTKVFYGTQDDTAVAIVPSFGKKRQTPEASIVSNSGGALLARPNSGPGLAALGSAVSSMNLASITQGGQGVTICLKDDGLNRRASVKFGGSLGTAIKTGLDSDVDAGCPA